MEEYRLMFIEEAYDLCKELEEAVFKLESNPDDKELIGRVFRVMHNMKGNSAIFGFKKINEFTHHLETIYDLIRNDKVSISKAILDLTLLAVDHLRILIKDENLVENQNKLNHEKLLKEIEQLINSNPQLQDQTSDITTESLPIITEEQSDKKTEDLKSIGTYHILFHPKESILNFGNNPIYILDELYTLGDCKVYVRSEAIPILDAQFDACRCYCYWEILLATSQGEDDIKNVFLFVEEDCKLEISLIKISNLFDNHNFKLKLEEYNSAEHLINPEELKNLAEAPIEIPEEPIFSVEQLIKAELKKEAKPEPVAPLKESSILTGIRVSSDKLDMLMNLVSELVTTQASLSLLAETISHSELAGIAENIEKISRRLRDNTFSICLVPIDTLLTRFQRLVRDLSSQLNKDIIFITEGTETELDKTIIENLADPLMHIFRNSIDHGIEEASVRIKKGKPAQGKIILKSFYSGANVHIQIQDDGGGIDTERVRQKAISKGLIPPDKQLSEKEILDLIFKPGFSTAENVTAISGRGVGMDVVKRKISDIRGEVKLTSQIDVGTTLTIILPLTLSIIDGLLVKIDDTFYVIPLTVVERCYEVKPTMFQTKYNNLVVIDGVQIPFVHLREELRVISPSPERETIVVVKYNEIRVGLVVDFVVGQYQAVLKTLGQHYKNHRIISGATILGNGTIALVLDTNQLINQYANNLDKMVK